MVAVDHTNGNTAPGVVTLLLGEAEQKVGDLSYRAADRWGDHSFHLIAGNAAKSP